MRIKLHGTPTEMTAILAALAEVLNVHNQSQSYPDRPPSQLIRVYLDVAPHSNGGRR